MNRWELLCWRFVLLPFLLGCSCGTSFEAVSTVEDASGAPGSADARMVGTLASDAVPEVSPGVSLPDASSTVDAPSSPPPTCFDVWEKECMPDAAVVACAGRCGYCPRLGVQLCLAK